MSSTESAGRATNPTDAATASTAGTDASPSSRLRTAIAIAVPPLGRRRMWLLLVESCPNCGYSHVHRALGSTGGRRAGTCGTSYYVRVVRSQGRTAA
jgi:hypothetical protein